MKRLGALTVAVAMTLAACGGSDDTVAEPDVEVEAVDDDGALRLAGGDVQVINGCRIEWGTSCPLSNLSGADLSGADLRRAGLSGADLSGANLNGANLMNANLTGVNFEYANLTGANLRGARLDRANLRTANLTGCRGFYLCRDPGGWED